MLAKILNTWKCYQNKINKHIWLYFHDFVRCKELSCGVAFMCVYAGRE